MDLKHFQPANSARLRIPYVRGPTESIPHWKMGFDLDRRASISKVRHLHSYFVSWVPKIVLTNHK